MDTVGKQAIQAAGFIDLRQSEVNLHENEFLLIEDKRISGFLTKGELPDDCELLDFSDSYALPGLVDASFLPHLMFSDKGSNPSNYGQFVWTARQAAQHWFKTGVTTAATLGAVDDLDKDLGDCVNQGKFLGPRLASALTPIVPAGGDNFPWGYGVRQVFGPDQARRAAREIIKRGAERLVVYADPPMSFFPDPQKTAEQRLCFDLEELKEIVTQASQAGCFVHAQAISAKAIEVCATAGVRSIGCAYQLAPEHFPLLKENGVALAPNLALGATAMEIGPSVGMSKATVDMVAAQRIPAPLLLQARDFGIEIICATNAAFLQGDMVKECLCLEAAGFSRLEILRSATLTTSKSLKPFCQTGSFAKNNHADIVFYERNPLENLHNLKSIEKIMLSGKLVDLKGG